jgi:DNA polymerase/3'-5' exonuclease PolX
MLIRASVAVWSPDDSNSIYPPNSSERRRVFWVGFIVLQPKQLGTFIGHFCGSLEWITMRSKKSDKTFKILKICKIWTI